MGERNPYAPPQSKIADVKETNCSRDGKLVVVQRGSDLPPRCIICNAPVEKPIKTKKTYWHSPWLYLLILINILLYAIVGIIVRKTFEVSAGLCEEHERKRKRRVLALFGGGVVALIIAWILVNANQDYTSLGIILFLVALVALVSSALTSRKAYPQKITAEYAKFAGCKEPFLESLDG